MASFATAHRRNSAIDSAPALSASGNTTTNSAPMRPTTVHVAVVGILLVVDLERCGAEKKPQTRLRRQTHTPNVGNADVSIILSRLAVDANQIFRVMISVLPPRFGKVHCYYELGPQFSGMDPGAAWEDFKPGIEHLTRWERLAIVTDD